MVAAEGAAGEKKHGPPRVVQPGAHGECLGDRDLAARDRYAVLAGEDRLRGAGLDGPGRSRQGSDQGEDQERNKSSQFVILHR